MEFDTKCNKNQVDDDFCIDSFSSKDFLQEFQHLDHHFSLTGPSFNPDLGIQSSGFDPFDPFANGSSTTDFDFSELKPLEENGCVTGSSVMQNLYKNSTDINISDQSIFSFNSCQDVKPINFVVPDECSYVMSDNHNYNETNTGNLSYKNNSVVTSITKQARAGRKKSKSSKGQWTAEEDRILIHLVEKFGIRKWSHIAQMLKGRIGKQCRERWHNHLRPDIKKDVWTEEEDRILIEAHAEVGNKWAEIAKRLTGRTENSIKNHWNATKRRQFSRRKCRTKWPRPSSLLQNYIKSLNLERGCTRRNASANASTSTIAISTNTLPKQENFAEFDYDFGEVPDFDLDDDKLFEGSSIDSLINDLPSISPCGDQSRFDLGIASGSGDISPLMMHCQVKKELDLMEMISQVGI